MGDEEAVRDFPDAGQRRVVCESFWDDARAAGLTSIRLTCAAGDLELQAQAEDGEGKRLRRFSMTAYTGVPMDIGFGVPVIVDLTGMRIPSQGRPILRDHEPTQIVGHTESIEVTQSRLRVVGVISGVGEAAQEVLALADNGFPWQASIGASIEARERVEAGGTAKVNGRVWKGPLVVASRTTLGEVSFVPVGADTATSVNVAAGNTNGEAPMTFEQWLAAKGWDASALSDEQKKVLRAAWQPDEDEDDEPAPKPPPPPPPPPPSNPAPSHGVQGVRNLNEVVQAQRDEEKRQADIVEMVAEAIHSGDVPVDEAEAIGRLAIEGKWDTQKTQLHILRAGRTRGVSTAVGRRPNELPEDGRVIEAAVCMAGNLENLERQFDERTLDAAGRRWKRGLGLQELILTFARRNGYHALNLSNLEGALKAAFRADLKAGMTGPSTYSLSGLLGNVANKFLKVGFDAVDTAWREISAVRSVSDFKQITSYTLTGALTYEKVAPGGEIRHGTISTTSYTNQAETYGRMLGLDRRDLINDDLGALTGAGRRLGRGGAVAFNNAFWTEFLDNSAFFTAGNNNVLTGAGSALSLASLEDADEKFRVQTDPDALPLGVEPRILLVPSSLRVTALNLMNSTLTVATTTANAPLPANNPFVGAYRVVSSPYMQNTSYTGNSSTAWYLLADPNDLPVIESVFLNGVQTPTVETADMDFNTLGISMRAFWDFGVQLQEYRAGVRSAGA